jgi:hypothetical protein
MKIFPKSEQEALKLVWDILNQGDSRYNDSESERILSKFIINRAVYLEEKEFPEIKEPAQGELGAIKGVQKIDKYIAKILLKKEDFKDSEIFFEREFLSSRPDVLGESEKKIVAVECCSCRIDKIIDYLSIAEEVWVLTLGESPWETNHYLKNKMQWFVFKKGENWGEVLDFQKKKIEKLKKIPSLL